MANTIDADLYPHLYSAVYKVARNTPGFIGAVNANFEGEAVSVDKMGKSMTYVKVPIAGKGSADDYTPAQTTTVGGNTTDTEVDVQITKSRMVPWHVADAEFESMGLGSDNAKTLFLQKAQNAMQDLMIELEGELATDIPKWASRARGTAGVTPFASDLSPLAACKRELDDNGAPDINRSFVMSSGAQENFLNLGIVQQADKAGSASQLRTGVMLQHLGFDCRVSTQLDAVTKGTATGYDAAGGESVGETTIAVDGSNSGTLLAGDVVTFAGDTNKYILADATQSASGAADGNIVINEPGLKATLADTIEGTTGADFTPNIAIQRDAYVVAVRPPIIKVNGYIKSVTPLADPISGLTFTLVEIPGDGLTTYRVHLAWGYDGINARFIMNYLG